MYESIANNLTRFLAELDRLILFAQAIDPLTSPMCATDHAAPGIVLIHGPKIRDAVERLIAGCKERAAAVASGVE